MIRSDFFSRYKAEIILAGILILSGFLNLWNIWNQGFSNEYYAAAVKSMLQNPQVAFFNSFDAAGFVTVDKPPVGLWVQMASAAIFGFSRWSVILPQVLAGVCSVGLLYLLVSRPFGKPAGLVSAFTLAVTPIFVAISRNGTMDGQLIFVILLSIFVAIRAAEKRSLPCFLLAMALIGIGFNIKMIQAFVVLPAVLAIYLLGARVPFRQKAVHLVIAVLILTFISLSWAVAVDMIPPDERPYIGSSGDNTVLSLIIGYNGMNRLGVNGLIKPGDLFNPAPDNNNRTPISQLGQDPILTVEPSQNQSHGPPPLARRQSQGKEAMVIPAPMSPISTGASMTGQQTGTPGVFRLFNQNLSGQMSWLIPFAFVGLFAWWRRPVSFSLKGHSDLGVLSHKGLTLLAMVLWLLPGLLFFSFTTGFWHIYYLATIAPPLAALVGIGAAAMHEAYTGEGKTGWLLVGAVLITGIVETRILLYDTAWSGILIPLILVGSLAAAAALIWLRGQKSQGSRKFINTITILAIALLFIAPSVWACTPLMNYEGDTFPIAGPRTTPKLGNDFQSSDGLKGLVSYLISHNRGETYLIAVPSSNSEGAALILMTGRPVMALGGFSGRDRILSVDRLKIHIQKNAVRFFLIPGISNNLPLRWMEPSENDDIFSFIKGHCDPILSSEWSANRSRLSDQYTLFDCAGAV